MSHARKGLAVGVAQIGRRLRRTLPVALGSGWSWIALSLLAILAAKLIVIGLYGNIVPFLDQWDDEAGLYHLYLNGDLSWARMISAHNEHRIFLSRVLFLVLLEIAGTWNVILQAAVNGLLHVATLGELTWLLRRYIPRDAAPVYALVLALVFAVPFDWENVVWGFQSQFYFLMGLSLVGVVLLSESVPFTTRWWIGIAVTALSALTMSSGALVPFAAVGIIAVQVVLGSRRRILREGAGVAVLLALGAIMLLFAVVVPEHAFLKAQGPVAFVRALTKITEWPFKLSAAGPVLLNAPMALLAWRVLRERPDWRDWRWRLLAIYLWLLTQFVAMAYVRALDPIASRYLDLVGLTAVVNVVATFVLVAGRTASSRAAALAAGWTGLLATGLVWLPFQVLPMQHVFNLTQTAAQQRNMAAFFRTGDARTLDVPYLDIPHVRAGELAAQSSSPDVQGLLPRELGVRPGLRQAAQRRLALHGGIGLEAQRTQGIVWRLGIWLTALVAGLLAALVTLRSGHQSRSTLVAAQQKA